MLLKNAHWILLAVCVLLVYVFYTASDESPNGSPNADTEKTKEHSRSLSESQASIDDSGGSGMFARLQALKPRLLPIMSRFSNNPVDSQNQDGLDTNALKKINKKKPISPLIMGKNQTRLKTIL